jgi:hypothetical protein
MSNLSTAEQCGDPEDRIEKTKTGERVIVDADATREYASNIYYWYAVNYLTPNHISS